MTAAKQSAFYSAEFEPRRSGWPARVENPTRRSLGPGHDDRDPRKWLKQADLDEGKRQDGLSTEEQEELRRLRRENRILREERENLKKAAAFSLGRPTNPVRVYAFVERKGRYPSVGCAGCSGIPERVLGVAAARALRSRKRQRQAHRPQSSDPSTEPWHLRGRRGAGSSSRRVACPVGTTGSRNSSPGWLSRVSPAAAVARAHDEARSGGDSCSGPGPRSLPHRSRSALDR